ncbi:MAG TPA: type II 3-dehydroquinate dehydratase [Actinomycetota bacterium]|nr:type II 3-dehydroquinate dehydratase [Actinomycetota bacterium]
MKAFVIHGPNLNLLGTRELSVYGDSSLDDVNAVVEKEAKELGFELSIWQTAREGEIIELLHSGIDAGVDGVLLNPAAYSHTSRAIADAVKAVPFPVIEVHLSNIHAREQWRRTSVTAEAAKGIVAGFGPHSYVAALVALKGVLDR